MVNPDFFQDYLVIRTEFVESVEFMRRIEFGIDDKEEYEKAMVWIKANCIEGEDVNSAAKQSSRERKNWEWEIVVKMTLIAHDLMIGNQNSKHWALVKKQKEGMQFWPFYKASGNGLIFIQMQILQKLY